MTTFSVSQFIMSFFPVALSMIGTIAVALGGLTTFRQKRTSGLMEATTTWRELADARAAKIATLEQEKKSLLDEIAALKRHETYLWEQINHGSVPSQKPPELTA